MIKITIIIFLTIMAIYSAMIGLAYINQEQFLFFPQKLDNNYQFEFEQNFEEINIKTNDGVILNGLLFKTAASKGLIFYLHGNAGSLQSWGEVAKTYTDLDYDVFIIDYRGYGKSEGKIINQNQLFDDNQLAYDLLLKRYNQDKIIILGYSIGTGLAAELAATNSPRLLILQAPYYNMTDMMEQFYPFLPSFILKYKLSTNEYLKNCKMPVVIFHGDKDEVIYYGSSLKLKEEFKPQDTLITLYGEGHNGMTENIIYKREIAKILEIR